MSKQHEHDMNRLIISLLWSDTDLFGPGQLKSPVKHLEFCTAPETTEAVTVKLACHASGCT